MNEFGECVWPSEGISSVTRLIEIVLEAVKTFRNLVIKIIKIILYSHGIKRKEKVLLNEIAFTKEFLSQKVLINN